ncbi:longitudinals lacking protein, isoforms A/B/D/L [Nilaparvata lugens]|uniref:longitudinals lacking protein, isoforms A/B/D/L n=1 Tax=Nilaparvata lugens TaxID=108931 RepID=UPI000B998CBB|nr:longitudinals lacking protein, isoforms A/B/D/L [Nilaparvata lugens]
MKLSFLEDVFEELQHSSKAIFKCEKCGRVYNYKSSLYAHQKHECGKEPSLQCPYCPHKSRKKNHLTSHVALKHFKIAS